VASSHEQAEADLRHATENCYEVFQSYARPSIESCVDTLGAPIPDQWQASWRKSLNDCTIDELNEMAWHSICWGGADELRHWLPRLLEINETHPRDVGSLDLVFVTNNLCRTEWYTWPPAERDSITRWFFSRWNACLVAPYVVERGEKWHRIGRDPTECLEYLLNVGLDLSELLMAWRRDYSEKAMELLAWAVSNQDELSTNRNYETPCGKRTETARRRLNKWLKERATASQLEEGFFRQSENSTLSASISNALYWFPPEWFSRKQ
jgi:hypothetical protein